MEKSIKLVNYGCVFYNPDLQTITTAEGEQLKLRPKSLSVFLYLAENSGRLISKDELFKEVWENVFATDDSLVQCIADIRRVFKDSKHKIIKTIPRKGYVFSPPPLQHADTPIQIDSVPFYGRQQELTELQGLLEKPECRLLLILGLGGVGKSKLSKALAHCLQSSNRYQDGVIFVSLASLQHSRLIPSAIATALGISLQGLRSPEALLIEALAYREILLILDNAEHLLPDIEIFSTLIASCPDLNIVLTSRLPMQLEGGWVYHLNGFKLPDNLDEHFTQSEAAQLFINTACRANHCFQSNQDDLRYIFNICKLVGGMPLGIEIAARWVQHLSCEEIANEVKQDLLALQNNSVPSKGKEQQQALGKILQQSWEMLTEREQTIVQTLSLFRGEFTRQSAEAIADVKLADYTGLISKSMISRNAEGRYGLHEVMRRYATEQRLQSQSHHSNLSKRFFDFHLEAARQADAEILGGKQLSNMQWFESEHTNFRECLSLCHPEHSAKPLDSGAGLELIGELGMFWFLANHWKEGREWAVNFLQISTNISSNNITHSKAFLAAGGLSVLLDDYVIADKYLSHGTEVAESHGIKIIHARGLAASGVLRRLQGRLPEAITYGRHSMALFESAGDKGGYQFNLGNLGHSLLLNDLYDEAETALEHCIRLNQQIGATISMPYALVNLGRLHWKLNQLDTAKLYLQQAIEVSDKLGILLYRAQALSALGWMEIYGDNFDHALAFFRRSADDYLRLGEREGLADAMKGVVVCKAQQGELVVAMQFMTIAEVLIEDWAVPVSNAHDVLLCDAMKCIKQGLRPEEQKLYRNFGLTKSPEELFRAL